MSKVTHLPVKRAVPGFEPVRGAPERGPMDGPIQVQRLETGELVVDVTHDGAKRTFYVSDYNAWRLIAMLAQLTALELPSRILKRIRMG